MISVSAERTRLPAAVEGRAVRYAREFGRPVAADDLFLLALTDLDESQPARQALAAVGVTAERLIGEVHTTGDEPRSTGGMTFSPAYYTFAGLAQGFAASLGDGSISPEHVLLAILWTGDSWSLGALDGFGVTREAIVEELRGLGVAVPQADLPPLIRVDVGEKVWFERDEVTRVLDLAKKRLGPVPHWGFNYESDRAWIRGARDLDLEGLVREALSQTS